MPADHAFTGPKKAMDALEKDFVDGLLYFPEQNEERPSSPQPTTKSSRKCLAFSDIDANVEVRQRKKKRTSQEVNSQESTWLILDEGEFGMQ